MATTKTRATRALPLTRKVGMLALSALMMGLVVLFAFLDRPEAGVLAVVSTLGLVLQLAFYYWPRIGGVRWPLQLVTLTMLVVLFVTQVVQVSRIGDPAATQRANQFFTAAAAALYVYIALLPSQA